VISLIIQLVANLRGGFTASFALCISRYVFYLGCLIGLRHNVVMVRFCALASVTLGLFSVFYNLEVTSSPVPLVVREVTEISVFPVVAFYMIRGQWEALVITGCCFLMYVVTFWQSVVIDGTHGITLTLSLSSEEVLQFFFAGVITHLYPIWIIYMLEKEMQVFHGLLGKILQASEDRNREKTIFISRMSHELRTPLHGLLSSANLLRQTSISEEQDSYLSTIDSCGEIVLDVVFKILEITRIESGNFESRKTQFSLLDLVKSIVESLAPLAESKCITLLVDCDLLSGGFDVRGDKPHLREVLLNLLGNAIKYTNTGSIVLRLRRGRPTGSRTPFLFEVEDSGVGISEADVPRIFTPFTQVHTNQRKSDGSGLGLSIAKRVIEALGGTIGVRSQLGVGSTFWFQLPFEVLPSGTLSPPLDVLPLHDRAAAHSLAKFFGCREPPVTQPPPNPVIGVCAGDRSLEILRQYLGYWRIPLEVLVSGEDVANFLARDQTLFLVDDNRDFLALLFAKIAALTDPPKRFSSSPNSLLMQEASGQLAGDGPARSVPPSSAEYLLDPSASSRYSIVTFSSLAALSETRKMTLSTRISARVGVATDPLEPLKMALAVIFLAGYDIRFRVGRIEAPRDPFCETHQVEDSEHSPTATSQAVEAGSLDDATLAAPSSATSLDQQANSHVHQHPRHSRHLSLPAAQDGIEVLVIEDNSVSQMIMRRQLEKLRVRFYITASAEEGVKVWTASPYPIPVILMDVEVEGALNGLQATAKIREEERAHAHARQQTGGEPLTKSYIAVMTGRAMEADKLEALACGCDEFLTKPVSLNVIRDLVRTHIFAFVT